MHSKFYLAIWQWATTLISTWTRWWRLRGSGNVYRIVHQKWLVQCANLMSSFLLVTEIHAFKVLPGSHTFALRSHWSLLGPDGKDSEGRACVHWIVHQKWLLQCANLMSSFRLVVEIHAFKVLPSHRTHTFFFNQVSISSRPRSNVSQCGSVVRGFITV